MAYLDWSVLTAYFSRDVRIDPIALHTEAQQPLWQRFHSVSDLMLSNRVPRQFQSLLEVLNVAHLYSSDHSKDQRLLQLRQHRLFMF